MVERRHESVFFAGRRTSNGDIRHIAVAPPHRPKKCTPRCQHEHFSKRGVVAQQSPTAKNFRPVVGIFGIQAPNQRQLFGPGIGHVDPHIVQGCGHPIFGEHHPGDVAPLGKVALCQPWKKQLKKRSAVDHHVGRQKSYDGMSRFVQHQCERVQQPHPLAPHASPNNGPKHKQAQGRTAWGMPPKGRLV